MKRDDQVTVVIFGAPLPAQVVFAGDEETAPYFIAHLTNSRFGEGGKFMYAAEGADWNLGGTPPATPFVPKESTT